MSEDTPLMPSGNGRSPDTLAETIEPERYEIHADPIYRFELNRRDVLKLVGGGLVISVLVRSRSEAQESGRSAAGRGRSDLPQDIAAWVHIDDRGAISVFTGKTEIGQNIRTSLTQAVADELRVAPASIAMVMADTARTPYDMGTFGSRTTPTMAPQLRRAAAAARQVLTARAAERWQVDPGTLACVDGHVRHTPSGRTIAYGELTQGRDLHDTIVDPPTIASRSEWRVAGTALPKIDGRAFVTGRHEYASDITRPGMLHGVVVRPPSFGATLGAADLSAASAIPNASAVRDGDFIGVAAPDIAIARHAAGLVRAEWRTTPQISGTDLFSHLRNTAKMSDPAAVVHAAGSIDEGRKEAVRTAEATYTVAYIAHVPLEPRAAVAEWAGDVLTVWTGTQRPFAVREELADAFRVPLDRVRVIVPDMGSGYGGKHTGEVAIEAARLARQAGHPVKVVWTREEELTWAYFRPAGVIDVKSGVAADGRIAFWSFENFNSGAAAIRTPYDVPHQHVAFYRSEAPLRQGSYRGLAATANQFARESHMEALAELAGADAVDFRLRHIPDERLRRVLQTVAERAGWGRGGPGARGIACGFEKGGYIATAVSLSVDASVVRLHRIVAAFDCGAAVNPDGLKNQIEGALVQGLGGALFEAVQFDHGRIINRHLAQYRVPRFSDVPPIDVTIVEPPGAASAGAGETPLIALAPAIAGALYRAGGTRLRSLPLLGAGGALSLGSPLPG